MNLSATQQRVLDEMVASRRPLVRWPGGFWVLQGTEAEHRPGFNVPVPVGWFVTVQTVRAMERQGLLVRTHEFPERVAGHPHSGPEIGALCTFAQKVGAVLFWLHANPNRLGMILSWSTQTHDATD